MRRISRKLPARLGIAVLMCGAAPFVSFAAQADECACSSDADTASPIAIPFVISAEDARNAARSSIFEHSPGGETFRDWGRTNGVIRLTGSGASGDWNPDGLKAGETERTSFGVEMSGGWGALASSELKTRFTEAQVDSDKALFDLQSGANDSRRALEEFSMTSRFLGDRLVVSSYKRNSTVALFETAEGDTAGELQQSHVTAALWRSPRMDFDFDASLSRTSANYFDFGDSPDADLHGNDSRISQFRSKIRYGDLGFSLARRDTVALLAQNEDGSHPGRSETEGRVSLNLGGLYGDLELAPVYRVYFPDSVWVAANNGVFDATVASATVAQSAQKLSLGTTRNFGPGTLNVSYWTSDERSLRAAPVAYHAGAHGLDIGSNLRLGAFALNGNVSFLGGQNFDALSDSAQSTINCTFSASWKAPLGALLNAGVTTSSFQNEIFGYSGLEERHSFRYQLSLDLSQIASKTWARDNVQLKFSASFQGNRNRSQTEITDDFGTVFTGLQLAFPIHS